MRRQILGAALLSVALAAFQPLEAQPGRPGSFSDSVPDVGDALPDLTLHDAEGKAVQLQDLLQGHYTVLVLGCLT